jgi:serine/threonine-protein kinase
MYVNDSERVGAELAGYRIDRLLERGGMSVVYLAEDRRLKRKVALKLLSSALANDESFRVRFLEESELAASIDHPNIVPIYEAGEAEDHLFIAMRYVEGSDLKQRLRDGPLEPEQAIDLLSQVAGALDAAHDRGLVHRDVKPSNVLIAPGAGHEGADHAYLADFGLTKRFSEQGAAEDGHLMGTIDYVAPEQIAGDQIDGRVDVYSLGCLLYECLAGEPPFRHDRDIAVLYAHLEEDPPAVTERRPELPAGIDAVVRTALAKAPDDRYGTCRELVDAARLALGLAPARRLSRRRLVALALAGAAAVAAAAAVPAILAGGGSDAAPAPAHPPPILPLESDSVVSITASASLARAIPIEGAGLLASGEGALWVASSVDPVLARVDPATGAVEARIDLSEPGVPTFLAAGEGGVWLGRPGLATSDPLWKYEPASGSLVQLESNVEPHGVAVGEEGVWVGALPSVVSIDPVDGDPVFDIDLRKAGACDCFAGTMAAGEGAVWVVAGGEVADTVFRVDPSTGDVSTVALGAPGADIVTGSGSVWVTNPDDDVLFRIDPATNRIAESIRVGRIPTGVAVGGGFVWVASARDGTVTRVDPATADLKTVDVGGVPRDIAFANGALWVSVDAG